MADVILMSVVRGFGVPPLELLLRGTALELATSVLWLYFYAIFLYALMSLIAQGCLLADAAAAREPVRAGARAHPADHSTDRRS